MADTEGVVVVLVWTRYQYRLAQTLLGKLGVPARQCVFIIEAKAVAQGVAPADDEALEWHAYEEGRGIRGRHAGRLVESVMRGRPAARLVLRNYNSKIGQRLLSRRFDEVYILEDGLASYMPRSSLGLPFGLKEKVHALATRVVNAGRVRVFPAGHRGAVARCGMFAQVEEWAGGRYIDVLPWGMDTTSAGSLQTDDALILDQPLHGPWDALKKRMLDVALATHPGMVTVYMHPSSTATDADAWRDLARGVARLKVVQAQSTVEEYFMARAMPANVYAMCSSALYVLRRLHGEGLSALAFASGDVLRDNRVRLAYRALSNLGIPVHGDESWARRPGEVVGLT